MVKITLWKFTKCKFNFSRKNAVVARLLDKARGEINAMEELFTRFANRRTTFYNH